MDLFKVFDEAPEQHIDEAVPGEKRAPSSPVHKDSKKAKKADESSDNESEANGNEEVRDNQKPLEQPKVTDSVELETTQQIKEEGDNVQQVTHQVRHDVALPPDYNYIPISQHKPSDDPARSYPFTLDPFQQMSVNAIERGESVLVSAHTSAGKTVVAEYAIAQSLREKQRVIYTSPIKALSNQKYRELLADFGDVGLMTGDVTINPDASCLVMTTEILRSMLYRGSEVMREVAWVVFDEIHYMRDKERGVVWEETIILLPDNVRYVFLSATIPNAMEFAEWVCEIHSQPCHVVYTNYRPTPLQHYLFPEGGSGIQLVVDERGQFREENFHKAMSAIKDKEGSDALGQGSGKERKKNNKKNGSGGGEGSDIFRIIKMIMIKNFNPVIVFSFSKRECENLAMKLSKLDFNSAEEHDMVSKVFRNAMDQLSQADQQLQQIQAIFPLLKRGIGVHHSGLLPILKEVIELLFQEGLLKVLFATETFSIGLNMPAKTVVFTSVRKFDGKAMRWVSGGEYIQMSGRAGRRGLDDRGIVIMMINEQMEPSVAKGMVKGVADRLDSSFHLGYNMILNLLRVEGISPEYMLERCFFQFQNTQKVPQLEKERLALLDEARNVEIGEKEDIIADYWNLRHKIADYGRDMSKVISHPGYSLPFLKPGRIVRVVYQDTVDFGWGVLVAVNKRQKPRRGGNPDWNDHQKYILDVVVDAAPTAPVHLIRKFDPQLVPGVTPPTQPGQSKAVIIPFTLESISQISQIRVPVPPQVDDSKKKHALMVAVTKVKKRFNSGLPLLDPIEDMKIKDEHFLGLVRKTEVLEAKCSENDLAKSPELSEIYEKYSEKQNLLSKAESAQKQIQDARSILQMDELKSRKRVLRKLGFSTPGDVVELKGRVACEISSGDELLLTELIFNGTFGNLTPEQITALLSCFVFDERVDNKGGAMHPDLKEPFRAVQTMAKKIAQVSVEAKLPLVEDDYVQQFKPELMDVVFQWARGATFAQICKMTDVFEGSLIRIFRRLEELLRQMSSAANTIGNEELVEKMDKALSLIQRDLVSAASLYL